VNKEIIRIIDANANRLKEALRVIEEVARFKKNHKRLTAGSKKIRHQVQKIFLNSRLPYEKMLEARNSEGDVGRSSRVKDKKTAKINDILVSNFKRAEESARVLEEFFKLVSEKDSKKFQTLRFKIYSLEKELIR